MPINFIQMSTALVLAILPSIAHADPYYGPVTTCSSFTVTNPSPVTIHGFSSAVDTAIGGEDSLLAKRYYAQYSSLEIANTCPIGEPTVLSTGEKIIPGGHSTLPFSFSDLTAASYLAPGSSPAAVQYQYPLTETAHLKLNGWIDVMGNWRLCSWQLVMSETPAKFNAKPIDC